MQKPGPTQDLSNNVRKNASPLPSGGPTALITGVSALVSGATGLFGGHLAATLAARGYRVKALARVTSDTRKLEAIGVEIAHGDLDDESSLRRACEGAQVVFHSAGKVTDWGPRKDFFRTNVGGTTNVVAACQATGVERLMHVSSLTVLGLPRHGEAVDESTPYGQVSDPYSASKIEAEKVARAAHGQQGLTVTVVRPGVIWGPGDITIIPRFAELLRRGTMIYVAGGKNLIALSHVENLASGTILAAEAPAAAGQVYHITDGEELTMRSALTTLAEALGAQPPHVSLPFWTVWCAAAGCELSAWLQRRRQPPAMTRFGVRLSSCHCRYNLDKARRELDYQPRIDFRGGMMQLASDPVLAHTQTAKLAG